MSHRASALCVFLALAPACADAPATGDTGGGTTVPAVDSDLDGVPDDEDCEPNNVNAYPGHEEVPYDGVDNDCAGDGDLEDFDGDGHRAEQVGGDDCNDGNDQVHPGAEEVCYDNLDNNCDGIPDTDDCDGDGFDGASRGGDDCDDTDAAIYPGAPEVWYDGIDQNCAGFLESDYDQDLDGHDIDTHGGDDCDDEDPTAFPSNIESWDAIDHDCDGKPAELNHRDAPVSWVGLESTPEGWVGWSSEFYGDPDGDGVGALLIGAPGVHEYYYDKPLDVRPGRVYLVEASSLNLSPDAVRQGRVDSSETDEYLGWDVATLDDLDGDGWPEVLAGSPLHQSQGAGLVFSGQDLLGDPQSYDAHASMTGNGLTGADAFGTPDLDGDGLGEVGVGTGAYGVTHVVVYASSDVLAGGSLNTADCLVRVDGNATGGATVAGPDLDADGVGDVLIGYSTDSNGQTTVLLAADVADQKGSNYDTTDLTRLLGSTSEGVGLAHGWLPDVDGNGYGEAVLSGPYNDGDAFVGGRVMVVDGSELNLYTTRQASDASLYTVNGTTDAGLLRPAEQPGDYDADGTPDLVVMATGDGASSVNSSVWVHFGPDVAAGGTVASDQSDVTIQSFNLDDLTGWSSAVGDLDGDGDADLALGGPFATRGDGLQSVFFPDL